MPVLQAFHRPESLDEAFELLTNYQGRARALAGGTSLALATGPMTDALVDLSPVGIDAIVEQNDSLRVGAMARCATLRAKLAAQPGAVVDSVERMYTRVLQNQITVGGNCVLVTGWTDLPVAAWAVDAKFTLQSCPRAENASSPPTTYLRQSTRAKLLDSCRATHRDDLRARRAGAARAALISSSSVTPPTRRSRASRFRSR
jgi:CO/xanthine dehydrogenase FAD-binding subunit